MPAETIQRIRSDQEAYDRNPQYWEELEQSREQERQMEMQAESDYRIAMYESQYDGCETVSSKIEDEELPF